MPVQTDGRMTHSAPWVTLDDLAHDPYSVYRRLREQSPVMWVPVLGRFVATGYGACHAIEHDPDTYSSDDPTSLQKMAMGHSMIRKDDPVHLHERKSFGGVLKPKAIMQTWDRVFALNTETAVQRFRKLGAGADFHSEFSTPLAAENLRQVIGFRNATAQDLQRWSQDLIDGAGNYSDDAAVWARCAQSSNEINVAIAEMHARLASDPDASLLSQVFTSDLAAESVAANVKLAISGGLNEPRHVMGSMVWALLDRPDQLQKVIENDLWNDAFDETLRWVSPLSMYVRTTTRDTELAGVHLPQGSGISVSVGAANRDPSQFEDPETFTISRDKKPHLGFGNGSHFCAGAWVARAMVVKHAMPTLFAALPTLRLDHNHPPRNGGWVFRGPTTLPLLWND